MKKVIIENKNGLKATFTNYGARLMSLLVPDIRGNLSDIVLGFHEPKDYLQAEEKYFGVTVGRYTNRIAKGIFCLSGVEYQLTINNPPNNLHGGNEAFHEKIWQIVSVTKDKVIMSCESIDGEEGFPGNIKIEATFHITAEDSLKISYHAKTDKPTPINLTHHSFFNLKGGNGGSIENHILTIYAEKYTPVNAALIPLGIYESVENTPFDFRTAKTIGQDINSPSYQIKLGNGYDHNFVLKEKNSNEMIHAATVYEPISGRKMEVHTNQPGIQFYTANWLSGNDKGKLGKPYRSRTAFCLETQHFPDTPNQASFPSCTLLPNEVYNYSCEYKFG
jgi:aldose 1-epimerase